MKIYLDSRKVIKGPVMILSNYKDRLKIKQGYNKDEERYWILITDNRSKITFRIHFTEEEFHDFWNNASLVAKIHDSEIDDDYEAISE